MKAIQIETFGNPAEVAKLVDIPEVGTPGAGEVVIAVEASPINPYDLLMISVGTISAPVAATYGFDQFSEAITKAAQSGGKVLFTPKK
jgi:NADPH:quinone reductase-like Zn-dependent oxidoreductase